MAQPVGNKYSLARLDSTSDCSTNKDDSVRSGTAIDIGSPFVLIRTDSRDDDGHPKRTGNVWTAAAHVVTAVIGSGVLSLAWSMAQIGWVAGPIMLLFFAFVTFYDSLFLADCYRSPEGRRNYTYRKAVKSYLGRRKVWLCSIVQYTSLIGTSIGYTITASISMVAITRSNCFYKKGHQAQCGTSNYPYMILFGVVEMILSQIPDFDRLWWLSTVAAIMSFSYSFICLGLSIGKLAGGSHSHGTLTGVAIGAISPKQKTWSVFQALGNIAFAYSFTNILVEIQDTIRSPPPENTSMKKATTIGIAITTLFYVSVGCIGYAAFGNDAPGNMLTGFGFYNPYWLVDFGNACIVVHLVGAYQVFCQPVFAAVEKWVTMRWPEYKFLTHQYKISLSSKRPLKLSLLKLLLRTLYVTLTTIISMVLPFFNDILGLLGAIAFWPLTAYLPISMHISQNQLKPWTQKWVVLQILCFICLLVSLAAALGSLAGIAEDLKKYTPFKTQY